MNAQTPAWPHRPPVGATLAMLASVVLGCGYCWATAKLLDSPRRELLPLYVESRLRMAFPMARFARRPVEGHRFVFPNHSSVTVPPAVLYRSLRQNAFGGRSVLAVFAPAGIAFALTFVVLVAIGASWDRNYVARSRAGRLIRGPRVVTATQYNRATRGDGLRFEIR